MNDFKNNQDSNKQPQQQLELRDNTPTPSYRPPTPPPKKDK